MSIPVMNNTAEIVRHHAETSPDDLALVVGDREWTYLELDRAIGGAVAELRSRGVGPGDRVLMVMPTSAEFVFVYFAAFSLGASVVTVNTLSTPAELRYYAEDAECSLAVTWRDSAEAMSAVGRETGTPVWVVAPAAITPATEPHDIAQTGREDAAVILYTSGTTGRPKGAVLTHANILDTGDAFVEALGTTREDRVATGLPLYHVFGQVSVMTSSMRSGASVFLLHPFDGAAMLQLVASRHITALSGVPTMWIAMLHAETDLGPEDFAALRMASSGGAAMPLEVAQAFQARFGARILDGYGLSETAGAATVTRPEGESKELSVGPPLPGTRITVLDDLHNPLPPGEVGEVAIDGPMVMKEYWRRPEATAAATAGRWFLTGDLGRMDEDGNLWIVDRKKDLVIRGGYNVYPREVEEQIYGYPGVREAAVIGLPDDRLGEEVAAVIAPTPGQVLDPEAIRTWLGESLSPYKVPRVYMFMDSLPKGPTGKLLKRGLDKQRVQREGIRVASSRPNKT